ncbi:HNH endonuclease signature motif containing protein [Halomonas piscis]|uniref:HNH endonuclease signature motif containing protein n=1 Tax=Halomonas piscis TaxID=3031727 RepID=UPI00289C47CA|nr:HNH endonuclease signature motif containing protein [Halomonas piscis]
MMRNQGKPWSDDDKALFARLYPHRPNYRLADIFGRSLAAINNEATRQGVRKTEEYMRTRQGLFFQGQRAWNAGMKGLDLGGHAGQFKPGNKPPQWRPIGHERVTKEGTLQRKMTDTGCTARDYRSIHVMVWEEHNGPVPPGHIIRFKDGDNRNFDPDNLEAITRSENMKRNSVHRYPPKLARMIQLRGALNRQLNKERRHEHES